MSQSKTAVPRLYVKRYIRCSARFGVGPNTFSFIYQWQALILKSEEFFHFAVDTTFFASDSDFIHVSVNRELIRDNWLNTNKLSLNLSEISYLIISNQKNEFNIKIRDSVVTKVTTVSFHGITWKSYLMTM